MNLIKVDFPVPLFPNKQNLSLRNNCQLKILTAINRDDFYL